MRLFSSGPDVPGPVRATVTGKPLAAVQAADGTWLVGTRDALHAVDGDGALQMTLRWEQVQRADWDLDTETLRVQRVEDYGQPVTATSYVIAEPGGLLPLVRERVTASVLLQRRVDLERRRGFSVIARRPPTGGGEVTWAYELDAGVDPDDPQVLAAAEVALQDAKESLGLI
jgi:hypothetical protein